MLKISKTMKGTSDLLDNSFENIFFFNEGLLAETVKQYLLLDAPQKNEKTQKQPSNPLTNFWKKLIFKPDIFPQSPNTSIYNILEEEKGEMATNVISSVLSKKLELSLNSAALALAMENSIKIFHEDFPWDFILEYNGERLGMVLLDICYNSNNEPVPIYRFNPYLKSFQGLF